MIPFAALIRALPASLGLFDSLCGSDSIAFDFIGLFDSLCGFYSCAFEIIEYPMIPFTAFIRSLPASLTPYDSLPRSLLISLTLFDGISASAFISLAFTDGSQIKKQAA
ncbi:hypothetical protein [Alkalihalobacillus sp. 1P02AB]|uniref:hypothetical protein n=1 Tax=Alkalihalobacillus sp. 1P02AB TaxID=3132260 RepID=UPI0039A44BFB